MYDFILITIAIIISGWLVWRRCGTPIEYTDRRKIHKNRRKTRKDRRSR